MVIAKINSALSLFLRGLYSFLTAELEENAEVNPVIARSENDAAIFLLIFSCSYFECLLFFQCEDMKNTKKMQFLLCALFISPRLLFIF